MYAGNNNNLGGNNQEDFLVVPEANAARVLLPFSLSSCFSPGDALPVQKWRSLAGTVGCTLARGSTFLVFGNAGGIDDSCGIVGR